VHLLIGVSLNRAPDGGLLLPTNAKQSSAMILNHVLVGARPTVGAFLYIFDVIVFFAFGWLYHIWLWKSEHCRCDLI
jgi:hypothetical protein